MGGKENQKPTNSVHQEIIDRICKHAEEGNLAEMREALDELKELVAIRPNDIKDSEV